MKDKKAITFNRMRAALLTIARDYSTPDQLRRANERGKGYGLAYEEELEMAYENIQQLAALAVAGVRAMPLRARAEAEILSGSAERLQPQTDGDEGADAPKSTHP